MFVLTTRVDQHEIAGFDFGVILDVVQNTGIVAGRDNRCIGGGSTTVAREGIQ